jgi:hypothetical protein
MMASSVTTLQMAIAHADLLFVHIQGDSKGGLGWGLFVIIIVVCHLVAYYILLVFADSYWTSVVY